MPIWMVAACALCLFWAWFLGLVVAAPWAWRAAVLSVLSIAGGAAGLWLTDPLVLPQMDLRPRGLGGPAPVLPALPGFRPFSVFGANLACLRQGPRGLRCGFRACSICSSSRNGSVRPGATRRAKSSTAFCKSCPRGRSATRRSSWRRADGMGGGGAASQARGAVLPRKRRFICCMGPSRAANFS